MEGDKPRIWVGSLVIDCADFAAMLKFWSDALHYVPKHPPTKGWVILKDPEGFGPNISLNQTTEGPLSDYRLHLDLYSNDPDSEVQRLVGLGAKVTRPPKAEEDFTTLADPDGNLFDVISAKRLKFGER